MDQHLNCINYELDWHDSDDFNCLSCAHDN